MNNILKKVNVDISQLPEQDVNLIRDIYSRYMIKNHLNGKLDCYLVMNIQANITICDQVTAEKINDYLIKNNKELLN